MGEKAPSPWAKQKANSYFDDHGTSLVVQWMRIRLQMQGMEVPSLSGRIPHAGEQLSPGPTAMDAVL